MGRYSISIICIGIALLCLVYTWRNKRDFFQPVIVYIFSQSLTMGVSYLKLLKFMPDLGMVTWMAWIGGMLSFIAGTFVFYTAFYRVHEPVYNFEKKEVLSNYNWTAHFVISLILLLFFLAGAYIVYTKMGFSLLRFFAEEKMREKTQYGMFAAIAFTSSPLVVLFFAIASFKSINPYRWIRRISTFFSFAVPITAILIYPGRMPLFTCVAVAIILYNNIKKRVPSSFILLAMVLAIASFIGFGVVRAQYGISGIKGMIAKQVASLPYKYIANNYWNLDYAINTDPDQIRHGFTYGIDMFNGPLGLTKFPMAIRGMMGWDNELNYSIQKVAGLNTINYLWEAYKDFGLAGCFLVPFVAAFLMAYMYEMMKRRNTPFWWMLYAISIFYVGWSFFITGYKLVFLWLWVYIIALASGICSKKIKLLK